MFWKCVTSSTHPTNHHPLWIPPHNKILNIDKLKFFQNLTRCIRSNRHTVGTGILFLARKPRCQLTNLIRPWHDVRGSSSWHSFNSSTHKIHFHSFNHRLTLTRKPCRLLLLTIMILQLLWGPPSSVTDLIIEMRIPPLRPDFLSQTWIYLMMTVISHCRSPATPRRRTDSLHLLSPPTLDLCIGTHRASRISILHRICRRIPPLHDCRWILNLRLTSTPPSQIILLRITKVLWRCSWAKILIRNRRICRKLHVSLRALLCLDTYIC